MEWLTAGDEDEKAEGFELWRAEKEHEESQTFEKRGLLEAVSKLVKSGWKKEKLKPTSSLELHFGRLCMSMMDL